MDLSSVLKKGPDLKDYPDINSKFEAIVDFLSMDKVFLNIPDMMGFDGRLIYNYNFRVTDIHGSQTSHIKSTVREWLKSFSNSITEFISGDSTFDEITECLEKIRNRSIELHEKYNISNDLTFEESFRYYVLHNDSLHNIPYAHLSFDSHPYNELIRHFELRSLFFLKIAYITEEKLQIHLQPSSQKKNPYTWDSPNAELEISELLYALRIAAQRIQMNNESGGTFADFKRDFFGLFGLSDSNYNKKVATIKTRQYKDHFVNKLSEKFNEHHARLTNNSQEKSD